MMGNQSKANMAQTNTTPRPTHKICESLRFVLLLVGVEIEMVSILSLLLLLLTVVVPSGVLLLILFTPLSSILIDYILL
jgi:hypothetical protein